MQQNHSIVKYAKRHKFDKMSRKLHNEDENEDIYTHFNPLFSIRAGILKNRILPAPSKTQKIAVGEVKFLEKYNF